MYNPPPPKKKNHETKRKINQKKTKKTNHVRVLFESIAGCIDSIPYIFIWREKERDLTQ